MKAIAEKLRVPVRSVGMKLMVLILSSILACVMTVGWMAHAKAKDIVESKVSEAGLQTVIQLANNLDTVFRTYEDLSMQLLVDPDFQELVRKLVRNDPAFSRSELTGKLKDRLKSYITGNVSISGVMLIPLNPELGVIHAGSAQADRAAPLQKTDWYKQAMDKDGKVLWIPPQADGLTVKPAPPSIGLARVVKDSMSNKPMYLLLMEIHLSSVTKLFDGVMLGEGSMLTILDGQDRYISAPTAEETGQTAAVRLPEVGEDNRSDAVKSAAAGGSEVLAVYSVLNRTGWRLLGTVPVQELVKDAEEIRTMTLLTAGAAAVIAAGIGALVLLSIGRPLVRLRDLMNEGAAGNLAIRSSAKKRLDEIGELSASFNLLMDRIQGLTEQAALSAEEILRTAAELSSASGKTALSAKEIAVASGEIAGGAEGLAEEAEKGADWTSGMVGIVSQVIRTNEAMRTPLKK